MTSRTLTSLIVKLTGFILLVKVFELFGAYFTSTYMTASLSFLDKDMHMAHDFNKLYYTGAVIAILNLTLSLLLILKSDWISNKLVKTDNLIPIKLNSNGIMRLIIAAIGILYCAKAIYLCPRFIKDIIDIMSTSDENEYYYATSITVYLIKLAIGVSFILKAETLSKLIIREKGSL